MSGLRIIPRKAGTTSTNHVSARVRSISRRGDREPVASSQHTGRLPFKTSSEALALEARIWHRLPEINRPPEDVCSTTGAETPLLFVLSSSGQ